MSESDQYKATPRETLIAQIMDWNLPKNDREWAAAHEIGKLRQRVVELEERIEDLLGDLRTSRSAVVSVSRAREEGREEERERALQQVAAVKADANAHWPKDAPVRWLNLIIAALTDAEAALREDAEK